MNNARSPFSFKTFRALWIATVISNIGTWMNDVGAAWLMTSLAPSPLMVALVQATTTAPMFLLALPAGALADIVDRRRLLLTAQSLGLGAAIALALSSWAGLTTPTILLAATFALGSSAALSTPVFQAIVPDLVSRAVLPEALALNGLGINVARSIGPALGGLLVAVSGSSAVFALNALSFVAILAVIFLWRPREAKAELPSDTFVAALLGGMRYARQAPDLKLVLIRAIGFFTFSSALWAMLPLVARHGLGADAGGYGILLAFMGMGAVAGAFALRHLRGLWTDNQLSIIGSALFSMSTILLAVASNLWVAGAIMTLAGYAWISVMTTFNFAVQMAAPRWVKARALAIYLIAFQGAMTAGSVCWGAAAARTSVTTALIIAALGQMVALRLGFVFALPGTEKQD